MQIRWWLGKLMLVGGACLVAFSVGEVGLRLAGQSYPNPYEPDPYCGSRLQANFQGWFTKEGRAWVTTNSAGWRDHEHALDPLPGIQRIAILGDSFSEALQVSLEQTYWRRLEELLNQAAAEGAGSRVEVLNFGVSGYSTCQQLEAYRRYARPYAADLVVLQFFVENDLCDNTPLLAGDLTRPFLRQDQHGAWSMDKSFLESPAYVTASSPSVRRRVWLANHLRLWQVAREARLQWSQPSEAQMIPRRWQCYQSRQNEPWREAWSVTREALRQLRDDVHSNGAQLAVLVVSAPIQAHPSSAERRSVEKQLGVEDLFAADRRLESVCQSLEIPILALGERFQKFADDTGQYLHGFGNRLGQGHWNALGHSLAAGALASWLKSTGPGPWLPPQS